MFDDPSSKDLSPYYSVCSDFVLDVQCKCILNCPFPLYVRNEALGHFYRTNSYFLQAACIYHSQLASVFSNEQHHWYIQDLSWLQATAAELEAIRVHSEDRRAILIRAVWWLSDGYEWAFSRHKRWMWWVKGTWCCMSFQITTVPWKLRRVQMIFFLLQAPYLERRWHSYRSSCRAHSGRHVLRVLRRERGCEVRFWPRETGRQQKSGKEERTR